MNALLNEKNLDIIEKEKAKQNMLKDKALKKCNLDNIIELTQKQDAYMDIIAIPELCSNTISDYIVITFKDYNYSLYITMGGDIKLCMDVDTIQHAKYIEDYNLIDIEEGNEKLVLELYDYILTVNTNNRLEEFIGDKGCK